jgi:hypothetical protein
MLGGAEQCGVDDAPSHAGQRRESAGRAVARSVRRVARRRDALLGAHGLRRCVQPLCVRRAAAASRPLAGRLALLVISLALAARLPAPAILALLAGPCIANS